MTKSIKIRAQSREDLDVVSSLLQDATIKVCDLAYLKGVRRFAAVMNRFLWETGAGNKKKPMRVRTGFRAESILKASYQNIPFSDPDHILELLALEPKEIIDGNMEICLSFAGYASIRLEVELIDLYVEDLSQPWRAASTPDHVLK